MKHCGRLLLYALCFLYLSIGQCSAVPVQQAVEQTRQDIKNATDTLNAQRSTIHKEHELLLKNLEDKEKKLAEIKQSIKSAETEISKLQNESTNLTTAEQERQTNEILCELSLETLKAKLLKCSLAVLDKSQPVPAVKIQNTEQLLSKTVQTATNGIGPAILEGECITDDGLIHSGTLIAAGPNLFFRSTDKKIQGIAEFDAASGIARIKNTVNLPVSTNTSGTILYPINTPNQTTSNSSGGILRSLKKGGVILIPIILLGLFCAITAIWKFGRLQGLNTHASGNIKELLFSVKQNNKNKALQLAETLGQPLKPVMIEGILHADCNQEHLEEIMHERILAQIPLLEKGLGVLSVSAGVCPLLGLLGTVTGMIHTFELVTAFGTGKTEMISSGISEALITTEYGLMVAIPALLAHAWLSRRVKAIVRTMEQAAVNFVHEVKIKEQS